MSISLRSIARVMAVSFAVLITILSLTPETEDLDGATDMFGWVMDLIFGHPELGDKLAHFTAYGALAVTAAIGFAQSARGIFAVFVATFLFGTLMEFAQGFIGERETDSLDLIANMGGLAAGIAAGAILGRYLPNDGHPA